MNTVHPPLDMFPLHPAQENVFFDQALHPTSSMYNVGWYQVIEKNYEWATLQRAWHKAYRDTRAADRALASRSLNDEIVKINNIYLQLFLVTQFDRIPHSCNL